MVKQENIYNYHTHETESCKLHVYTWEFAKIIIDDYMFENRRTCEVMLLDRSVGFFETELNADDAYRRCVSILNIFMAENIATFASFLFDQL